MAMLVGGPEVSFDPTLVIAVVPDSPSMRAEADRIAAHFRSRSEGEYYIWTAFRQHGSKLVKKAIADGVDAILFVRDDENPNRRLYLSNRSAGPDEALNELLTVLGRLPEPYEQISGGD